uniref:Scaffolding anchor of CK1 domain-containing protein n=1 Tax=Mola mola TaxID=94237 RepID=A0A3Q3VPV9_MOLML
MGWEETQEVNMRGRRVRRRVQDLRNPSSSYLDFIASRPTLDLSHNESARLAADSLLSRGLEGYHEVLNAEGEVDFLSELEKMYILQNGNDGTSVCECFCPDLTPSFSCISDSVFDPPGVKTDLDQPSFEIYFQSDTRAASMKDLVREFIRKATRAVAIVMDSFSDVELLCDLLETSRKRNVCVHLVLDHLNLSLFISMWQELKLNSRNFPKLSVRSVRGQTYCAKTGRKLSGQIAESFIISDWTEVLTGSYSFSWLSWQVHRSLVVLMKGSAVVPFHHEFHRLTSSSKEVPGFDTYISTPPPPPLGVHATLQSSHNHDVVVGEVKSAQNKWNWNGDVGKTWATSGSQSSDLEGGRENAQPPQRAGTGTHTRTELNPRPPSECAAGPQPAEGAVCTPRTSQTQEETPNQIQSHLPPLSPAHLSYVRSQLSALTVASAAGHTVLPSDRIRQHRNAHQTPLRVNSNVEYCSSGAEVFFFEQKKQNRLMSPLGAAGQNQQRRQWNCPQNRQPQADFLSEYPKVLSPTTSQHRDDKTGHFSLTPPKGPMGGSSLGIREWQQAPINTRRAPEAPAVGVHRKPQFPSGSQLFLSGPGTKLHPQPRSPQQLEAPLILHWVSQGRAARPRPRPRPATRVSGLSGIHGTGQQAGWRPFHSSANVPFRCSNGMNERHSAGFRGAGPTQNENKT